MNVWVWTVATMDAADWVEGVYATRDLAEAAMTQKLTENKQKVTKAEDLTEGVTHTSVHWIGGLDYADGDIFECDNWTLTELPVEGT